MPAWGLYSRNAAYQQSGGLRLSSAKGVLRHLGVDTCIVETPYTADAYARTVPGCGIIVRRDQQQAFSGSVAGERQMGWDAKTAQATIRVPCVGDAVHLDDRLVFPDPTRAGDSQTTVDRWSYTGPASTAMTELIRQQLGPTATTDRRVPGLFLGDDPAAGAVRTWEQLWGSVLQACAAWSALSGANLGIRVLSTPDGLRASVVVPRDLSQAVRFSADLRNLTGFIYGETPPTVTYAIAAGQGDLTARVRTAAATTDPLDLRWGRRIESYIDRRDEDDTTKLAQAAVDAITGGAGQVNLTTTLRDTKAASWMTDWDLGDRVTVYVGLPGSVKFATVTDVVREIGFDVDQNGAETITPAIGSYDASAVLPTPDQKALADIGQRLDQLEQRR